jgi:beta-1,4-mannosyltransferase
MRVLVFWEPSGLVTDRANPYAALLASALAPSGVLCEAGFRENLTPDWVRANAGSYDIMHLHWPSGLYHSDNVEASVARASEMMDALVLARSMGCRIVWTMHNLYPHDSDTHELDHLLRLAITSFASAIIVHCEHARELLRRVFHREHGVFTIPHGHFQAPYRNEMTTAAARRALGLDDHHFAYLFFGTVRENKGVDRFLDLFPTLEGDHLRLIFAARIYNEYGKRLVERARNLDSRIIASETERFENDEFQAFYNAADVAVFPFTDILTSGSAITAMGFYCPVVLPALGCLPELIDDSVGYLYDPSAPDGLRDCLERAAAGPRRASFRDGIERKLQQLNWNSISHKTLEAYSY